MRMVNFIQKLRKVNHSVAFNLWHVRIGSVSMALFFLFAVGEMFVSKFIPMDKATQHLVGEAMSCISMLILGEAIMVSLYKLLPRRRWATLLAMAGGATVGLAFAIISDYVDGVTDDMKERLIALCLLVALFVAAFAMWRISLRRAKRMRLERAMARHKYYRAC